MGVSSQVELVLVLVGVSSQVELVLVLMRDPKSVLLIEVERWIDLYYGQRNCF